MGLHEINLKSWKINNINIYYNTFYKYYLSVYLLYSMYTVRCGNKTRACHDTQKEKASSLKQTILEHHQLGKKKYYTVKPGPYHEHTVKICVRVSHGFITPVSRLPRVICRHVRLKEAHSFIYVCVWS